MRTLAFALLAALLVVPEAGWAWNDCGSFDATTATNKGRTIVPGMVQCHDVTDGTDAPILQVQANSVSIEVDPDMDAADGATNPNCLVQVYRCRHYLASATDLTSCTKEPYDSDNDGTLDSPTLDGETTRRIGIEGVVSKLVLIVVDQNSTNSKCRTMVTGN